MSPSRERDSDVSEDDAAARKRRSTRGKSYQYAAAHFCLHNIVSL
jgi:hypothetical protein